MSLLDGLLRDALLQNVVQSNVYVAIRTDNPNGPSYATPIGSGTASDPYGGPAGVGGWFDNVMSTKVQDNQTVILGPGEFPTRGNDTVGTFAAWAPRNGLRLVGAGMGSTTIKLVDVPNSATRYTVGIHFTNATVDGFSLEDLTIDANLAGAGTGANTAGVGVRGKNIYIRRVRIINYGAKAVLSGFNILTAAGDDSENCVVEECVIEPPSASHNSSSTLNLFAFATISGEHRFCVIRNCAARGNSIFEQPPSITSSPTGISPGVGLGTIIEGNQFANLKFGVASLNAATKDLVIQNNYFRNVFKGIRHEQTSGAVGRVLAWDNIIELSRELALPIGLEFTGNANDRFADVILRKNIVRQVADSGRSLRTDAGGIYLNRCTRAIAENNLLSDMGTNPSPAYSLAVAFENCGSAKFFNNQTPAGVLLRGYNKSTSRTVLELEDAVQDVLLAT